MAIRVDRRLVIVLCAGIALALLLIVPNQLSNAQKQADCPTIIPPRIVAAAIQRFEFGYMVWIKDSNTIYVLYEPIATPGTGTVEIYPSTYQQGQPESDPSLIPPSQRYQPVRGFGMLWRTNQQVHDSLGWGTLPERGFTTLIAIQANKTWFSVEGQDTFTITDTTWQATNMWRQ